LLLLVSGVWNPVHSSLFQGFASLLRALRFLAILDYFGDARLIATADLPLTIEIEAIALKFWAISRRHDCNK
jgi:hypothetical protein